MQASLEEVTKKHDIDLEEVGEILRVFILWVGTCLPPMVQKQTHVPTSRAFTAFDQRCYIFGSY